MLNSVEINLIAIAIIQQHLSEGISCFVLSERRLDLLKIRYRIIYLCKKNLKVFVLLQYS